MAEARKYAEWLVANKDKKGTPEFQTVEDAYRAARAEEPDNTFTGRAQDNLESGAEAVADTAQSFGESAVETISDAGRGITHGVRGITLDALTLGNQMLGDQDALDALNTQKRLDQENTSEARERSPFAFGTGEFIGEGIALAPIGGASGAAAKAVTKKALGTGAKALAIGGAAALAAEGASEGFLTAEGDLVDRAEGAAVGAGTNLVMGKALERAQKFLATRKLRGEVNADALEGIHAKQDLAKEYGGYDLTADEALGSQTSLNSLRAAESSQTDAGQALREFTSEQNRNIQARITELTGGSADDFRQASIRLADDLAKAQTASQDQFQAAYRRLDELAKTQDFRLPNQGQLADAVEGAIARQGSASGIGKQVRAIFDDYGLATQVGTPSDAANFLQTVKDGGAAKQQLTFGTYEELRKKLNGLYGSMKLNNNDKALIEEAKSALDGYIDNAMADPKIGGSVTVRAARDARQKFIDYNEKWDMGELTTRLANSMNGEGPKVPVEAAVQRILKDGTGLNLTRTRTMLQDLGEEGQQAWQAMQAAPFVEAFKKATNNAKTLEHGGSYLDPQRFVKEVRRLVPEDQAKRLWGDDAEAIEKTLEAFSLSGQVPAAQTGFNPSGTAKAAQVLRGAGILGGAHPVGRFLRATAGVVLNPLNAAGQEATAQGVLKAARSGELSPIVAQEEVAKAVREFMEVYPSTSRGEIAQTFQAIIRGGTTATVVDNTVEEDEK